jgi:hypothetical protein
VNRDGYRNDRAGIGRVFPGGGGPGFPGGFRPCLQFPVQAPESGFQFGEKFRGGKHLAHRVETRRGVSLKGQIRTDGKFPVHYTQGGNQQKEVLGLWISENEGAKFWASVLNEIRNRGTEDILIAYMDGLTGFPDAVQAVFSERRIQRCIACMARNSVKFVSYKDLKAVCAELKAIYRTPGEEAGRPALEQFGEKRQVKHLVIYKSEDTNQPELCEFFTYPEEIRPVIYTTNAIESLNYQWPMPIKDWGGCSQSVCGVF